MKQLRAVCLQKKFGHRLVVDQLSFEVTSGEIAGLLGPNGAGKTTVFSMVIGLVEPDGGQVFLNGEDLTREPVFIRSRKGLGYLPQDSSVFRGLTVEENLLAVLENLQSGRSAEANRQTARDVLREFGLESLAQNKAGNLSGGERRKLEIARALLTEPQFLLLDEPFSELDPKAVTDLQEILLRLKQKNIGLMLTDHRVREVVKILDKIFIINKGKIVAEGRPEQVLGKKEVREIYLGEEFRL
ncbi:MAG: LPS export ABC transporter ATP-binding protein [Candidatus Saccharicenans sp.]